MKKLKAASIKYFKEDLNIPVISSFGTGDFAKKIIEIAKKNNIQIVENEEFFKFEKIFKIGKEIPQDLYQIVIDILVYIINTNNKDN